MPPVDIYCSLLSMLHIIDSCVNTKIRRKQIFLFPNNISIRMWMSPRGVGPLVCGATLVVGVVLAWREGSGGSGRGGTKGERGRTERKRSVERGKVGGTRGEVSRS